MKALLPEQFPEQAFSVEYALKDLGYALELADQMKVNGAQNAMAAQRAAAAGNGKKYFPVLVKTL